MDRCEATFKEVLTTVVAASMGAASLGNTVPNIVALFQARSAIRKVLKVSLKGEEAARKRAEKAGGFKPKNIEGKIEFEDVKFRYPTRPDYIATSDFSLTIPAGGNYAMVGPSGCGKSTCINLLERFYEREAGSISIDGVPIENYDAKFLRGCMGLVGQEPCLFDMTIAENIALGRPSSATAPTKDEIVAAAKAANAHDFIVKFPDGYDTRIGAGGGKLSGGQKLANRHREGDRETACHSSTRRGDKRPRH